MFEVAKKIDDKSLFIRLNTLCNGAGAVGNDVQCHQCCWLHAQSNAKKTNNNHCDTDGIESDDTSRVISDVQSLYKAKTKT